MPSPGSLPGHRRVSICQCGWASGRPSRWEQGAVVPDNICRIVCRPLWRKTGLLPRSMCCLTVQSDALTTVPGHPLSCLTATSALMLRSAAQLSARPAPKVLLLSMTDSQCPVAAPCTVTVIRWDCLQALIDDGKLELLQEMYRGWPFFSVTLDMIEMVGHWLH